MQMKNICCNKKNYFLFTRMNFLFFHNKQNNKYKGSLRSSGKGSNSLGFHILQELVALGPQTSFETRIFNIRLGFVDYPIYHFL